MDCHACNYWRKAITASHLELNNKIKRIKTLARDAKDHFLKVSRANIFEDDVDLLKVVKLYRGTQPVYFLLIGPLGAGAFGEVSKGIELDIESGVIIPGTETAVKITDFTHGGMLSSRDIPETRKETEHENAILEKINQSFGFSIGQRRKKVAIEIEEGVVFENEALVQEAIVAMPLYPGKDMQHEIHKDKFSYGSLTFAEAAASLCSKVNVLHEQGIIHSDLKPANIIWHPQSGAVNIVDFNRAKYIGATEPYVSSVTASDRSYMAPECFTKKGGYRFSKASDVYALGKVLQEKFNFLLPNGQRFLESKRYLGYDQLMIQPFLEQMTAVDAMQRPSASACEHFFKMIENKMKWDIEQPDNKQRLELSKRVISLEVQANQLRNAIQEIKEANAPDADPAILVEQTQTYEATLAELQRLTHCLSQEKIPKVAFTNQSDSVQSSGRFKERYQQITAEGSSSNQRSGLGI